MSGQVALTELLMQVREYVERMKQEEYVLAQFVQQTLDRFRELLALHQKLLKSQHFAQQSAQRHLKLTGSNVARATARTLAIEDQMAVADMLLQYTRDLRLPCQSAHNVVDPHCTRIDVAVVNHSLVTECVNKPVQQQQQAPRQAQHYRADQAQDDEEVAKRLHTLVRIMRALKTMLDEETAANARYMQQHRELCVDRTNETFLHKDVRLALDGVSVGWREQLGGTAQFESLWDVLCRMQHCAALEKENLQPYVTNCTRRFIESVQTYNNLLTVIEKNNNLQTRHIAGSVEEEEEMIVDQPRLSSIYMRHS
jgi:hypothetical protein